MEKEKKFAFKIKHLFERDTCDLDDYVCLMYDLMDFMSFVMGRDVNKDKFIKDFKEKYFALVKNV